MIKQNKMVIVKVKPLEYLKQGMRYCGGYTTKAILGAYNLDDGRHPKNYLPLLWKSLGFTTPKTIQNVLDKYDFDAPIKRVNKLPDVTKLQAIKDELGKNHPVILLIGNGYLQTGKYSSLKRQCLSHWISIWGYNDKEKVFFIYDSAVDPKNYNKIPVGNVKRTYYQVLRDWEGAFYFRFKNFLYIPIIKR